MSKSSQIKHQQTGLEKWDIRPLKSVFSSTQTKELSAAQLYKNLQRSLSSSDTYFVGNTHLFKRWDAQHNQQIFDVFVDYVVVDKDLIPDNFLKLFDLRMDDPNLEQKVIALFKRKRILDPKSARIVFIDDKIVIFRNDERLVHTDEVQNLTQWEKRRTNRLMHFNTFSSIYDAIRSQYYIIENSQNKQIVCKTHQQSALSLAKELRTYGLTCIQDQSRNRKFSSLVQDLEHVRNFRDLAASLYRLDQLTFKNSYLDSQRLEWAQHDFKQRFLDLQSIIGKVNIHLNDLELILSEHEAIFDYFVTQIKFANLSLAWENYARAYRPLLEQYGPIAPFAEYFVQLEKSKSQPAQMKSLWLELETKWIAEKTNHDNKLNEKQG